MTNKTLSQELAEIAGIKPVYFLVINLGDLDDNYKTVVNKRKYRLIADYRWDVDDEDELRNIKTLLPDFEKNNDNFMRLLEIFVKYDSGFIVFFSKKECLEEIIEYCDDGCNKLSKILQSENWSY